jgi:hypothetical protein
MLRRAINLRVDRDRESFSIFSKLSGKSDQSDIHKLADEIMTLSLKDLNELSVALNDPSIIGKRQSSFPYQFFLPKNRSPFPHPKHVFAGIDADHRPGMHTTPKP